MKQISSLAEGLLRATGIYSDAALERIENGLAANQGMPLLEGILKFGGEKETVFLEKIGGVLGLEYVEIEKVQPRPDVIAKLPASAVDQYNASTKKDISALEPGDLVFYGSGITHVALYIGDGQIVHAANSRLGIIVSDITWMNPVAGGTYIG